MDNWDRRSKLIGLKVPEHRCYEPNCKGKVIVKFEIGNYACKKHFKENPNSKVLQLVSALLQEKSSNQI